MSNAKTSGPPPSSADTHGADAAGDPGVEAMLGPPLRPQRKLLFATACVLVGWVGFLGYLYAATDYPRAGQVKTIDPKRPPELPAGRPEPWTIEPPPAATGPVVPRGPEGPAGPFGPPVPAGPPAPIGPPAPGGPTAPSGTVPR